MSHVETLGVLAHRGGLIVERPELSIGVVLAVSRPTGLELDLLARRPLDRRSAPERQADIRAGRFTPPAPRRLLPEHDEGMDLRIAWLDPDGRARWQYGGSRTSWSGDHYEGVEGPSLRAGLELPPSFDRASMVFAWPEIGFPETVVALPLPDRVAAERGEISVWDAPVDVRPPPGALHTRAHESIFGTAHVETGWIVAGPRVLHRAGQAVVVLRRLTAIGGILSMEILSVARGTAARAAHADAVPRRRPPFEPGPSIAAVHGSEAIRLTMWTGSIAGGDADFRCTAEFLFDRPDSDVVTVLVEWPAAGLPGACVDIPLDQAR
ncbi:hypothetical protein [Actinoplanes sp. NPDC049802]|uniref:hypothetical protein n=1 Tax=Actinoplanes sp. NPDC049802 TaxID=3154742 RepID=UPI00340A40A2